MIIEDNIKVKYSQEGYLPDYPPHLISRKEMFEAFIGDDSNYRFFYDYYPLLADNLSNEYEVLIDAIKYHISKSLDDENYDIPDWVYAYMLGEVISTQSLKLDIHDMLTGLNCDNIDDEITEICQNKCYQVSYNWVNKLNALDKYEIIDGEKLLIRPPTMFGEPHVMKSIRLNGDV